MTIFSECFSQFIRHQNIDIVSRKKTGINFHFLVSFVHKLKLYMYMYAGRNFLWSLSLVMWKSIMNHCFQDDCNLFAGFVLEKMTKSYRRTWKWDQSIRSKEMVIILPLAMFSGLKSQQVRFRINKESQRNKTDVTVFVDLTLKKTENRTTGSESRKYNNLDSRDYISLCFFQVSVKDHCQYICLGQSIVASYSAT